jgi:hypothetical protein
MSDATKIVAERRRFILAEKNAATNDRRNRMNRTPCIQPTHLTAAGSPAIYFNGMAIRIRMRKEIASAKMKILSARIPHAFSYFGE